MQLTHRRTFSLLLAILGLVVAVAGPAYSALGDAIADAVLGQPDFTSSGCAQGGIGATTLCTPYDAAADPTSGRLYVVELDNHRVMSWSSAAAFMNGQAADMVFGQPDFTSDRCNAGGVSASSLCKPGGVAVDRNGNLYIGDHRNNRVLEYDRPAATDTVADRVFGQPDFGGSQCDNGGLSAASLCGPRNPAIDPADNLYISDHQNHRVVAYIDPLTGDAVADYVWGQPDFVTQNCAVGATSMCEPRGIDVDSSGTLYVADAFNQRVLAFINPLSNAVADKVFGQSKFTTRVQNKGGVSATSLWGPRDVSTDNFGHVFIADTRNHRILLYNNPLSTDTRADGVIGQPNFSQNVCNNGGLSASSICEPRGLGADAGGNLYVPDSLNDRLLRFDQPAA